MKKVPLSLSLVLSLSLLPIVSMAQSLQVIGGNSFATECFRESTMAAKLGSSSSQSIDICNKALHHGNLKQRDRIATYVNRGVIYASLSQYNKAVKDYQKAITLDGTVAEPYLNRGNLWFLGQKWQKAMADYDKSIELKLSQAEVAYFNRGMAKEQLGLLEEAKIDYLTALELRPEWNDPQEKLERVQSKINASSG